MRVSAVIPAAGKSLRFFSGGNSSHVTQRKQFRTLLSEPLIFTTLQLFLDSERIDTIVLVAQEDALNWLENQMEERHFEKEVRLAVGGERRQDSVRNGLDVVAPSSDVVVVHDEIVPCLEARVEGASQFAADVFERFDPSVSRPQAPRHRAPSRGKGEGAPPVDLRRLQTSVWKASDTVGSGYRELSVNRGQA